MDAIFFILVMIGVFLFGFAVGGTYALPDENEDNEEQEEESVFAKLKSNKANKPENKLKITRDDVVCEKSNKYMKRGEIKESMLYVSKKEETEKSTLGFADWKKCFDFGATFKMDEDHNWPTDD